MFKLAIPLLHVTDSVRAESFYCEKLGFRLEFAHRLDQPDPCYMGVSRDSLWMHLSSHAGDGVAGGVVNVLVDDIDALHLELQSKNVPIALGPVDQTWGNREMYVKDADGNSIRFLMPR